MQNDKDPWQGRGAGCIRPSWPSSQIPASAAEPQPRDPTYPCCSRAVVFSLWALPCGGNIHLVNPRPLPMWVPPGTTITHLLGREIPASPGKPPPASLPGHLLFLQLVHGALRAEEGHWAFLLPHPNPPYLALGGPMNPESGADPRARGYQHVEAKEAYSPHLRILSNDSRR